VEINFLIAFFFGILSFFSPCVLPLVPGYIAIFSNQQNENVKINRIKGSIQFVIGFSFVFVSLGALATTLGSFFSRNAFLLGKISGVLIIFFGILLILPNLNIKYVYGANLINLEKFKKIKYFTMGFAFGFGFTPCIGPVLGALLTLSSKAETINVGIFYLVVFSLGLALPFIFTAVLFDKINLNNKIFQKFQKYSSKISGIVLIYLGILIYTDKIYILASLFQDFLILINLEWLSTI